MIGRLLCLVGLHSREPYMVVDDSFTGCMECSRCEKHWSPHGICDRRLVSAGWVADHTPLPLPDDPEQWAGGAFSLKTLRAAAALNDPEFPMPSPEYFDP